MLHTARSLRAVAGCYLASMLSDGELLRCYVEEGSEDAFTELVQRHVSMVYLAALRRVGRNAHAAEDVTQAVFTDLARKARSLRGHPSLVGWLYTGTRFAAAQAVRTERRRRAHEEEAHTMNEFDSPPPVSTDRLEPFLDEVLDLLDERDRHAVLLHFFEGRTFAEIGAVLSLSADAARMRVNRALERLRAELARRGVASSAAILTATLSAQSTLAAPAPLALAVASHALRDAGATHAVVSLAVRLVQAAKSSSFVPWAATAVVIGAASLAFYSLEPPSPAAAPLAPASQPKTAPLQSGDAASNPAEVPAPDFAPSPSVRPSPPPEPGRSLNPPAAASDFDQLSVEEKNILAMLWAQRNLAPPPNGGVWGLRIGPEAPNFKGCAPLLKKGLVNIGKVRRIIYLNKFGLAFCEANARELDAYPVPDYRKPGSAR